MKTYDCIKFMYRFSEGSRAKVIATALAGCLHVAASMGFVLFSKRLIDTVTNLSDSPIGSDVAGMLICMILQVILSAYISRLSALGDIQLKNRLRHQIFTRMMYSRWNGKEIIHSGDTVNRMTEDVRVISDAIINSFPSLITASVQFLAAFVFLVWLEPFLALLLPAIILVALLLCRRFVLKMRRMNSDIRKTEGNVHSLIQESLRHRLMIHSLERSSYVSDSLADQQQDLDALVTDKTGYSVNARMLLQFGFAAGYATAFLWGAFGIRSGAVSFGMMTAFLQLVAQVQRPVVNMARKVPSLINSLTSAERLQELFALPSEEYDQPVQMGDCVGVRFENVSFSYPDSDRHILKDFTHDFAPGSSTALVGETGIGKSTMLRLMLGLLSPESGCVSVYNSDSVFNAGPGTRCNMVYVPQGNTLMSGTIRDNLLLGNPDATEEDMLEALQIASAGFILELPDGLDTNCGEGGAGLSEGQAQRIAIARGLLHKGAVLLLDEPTSSLDAETEDELVERLLDSKGTRTLIIITHREATAAKCHNRLSL